MAEASSTKRGGRFGRFLKRFCECQRYVHLSHNLLQRSAPPPMDRFPVHALGPQHAAALRETGERIRAVSPSAPRWIDFSLRMRYPAFVAFDSHRLFAYFFGVPAGHANAAAHPHVERFRIPLQRGDVYLYDFFVEPEYRGAGRAMEFLFKMQEQLRADGHRRIVAWCDASNAPALAVYRKMGWTEQGRSSATILLRWLMLSGGQLFVRNGRSGDVPVDFRPAIGRRST